MTTTPTPARPCLCRPPEYCGLCVGADQPSPARSDKDAERADFEKWKQSLSVKAFSSCSPWDAWQARAAKAQESAPSGEYILVPVTLLEWAQQNIDCIEEHEERQRVSTQLGKYILRRATAGTTAATAAPGDLLREVADVLSENNWRGDLVEALRDLASNAGAADKN